MDVLAGRKGARFSFRGRECVFTGYANGRAMITSGDGWYLEVPDPDTGLPVWPLPEDVTLLSAQEQLIPRSDPLENPVRSAARQEELSRKELVDAKLKKDPTKRRDRNFTLREMILRKWDAVEHCSLSEEGIKAWLEAHFDTEALKYFYGRLPCATTFRTWINDRGRRGDRRPTDFASFSSVGPRRRRIHPAVLDLIKLWALDHHKKPKRFVSTSFKKATDDVERLLAGKDLEIFEFERSLPIPVGKAEMCSRRIFQKEVERAKGAQAFGVAYGMHARRQRFGGGGVAQEPSRFLEIVQLDDTPFPMVFVIDPVRRIPIGVPTVTIALCIYTRVIVGWDISYDTPSHSTFMRTLYHSALPKLVPESHATIPELAGLGGKVVGHYLLDNAMHQTARAAQDIGGDIGSGVRWAGKKQPTHKGHVESCLKTLQNMLREELPAGTWDIPLMR